MHVCSTNQKCIYNESHVQVYEVAYCLCIFSALLFGPGGFLLSATEVETTVKTSYIRMKNKFEILVISKEMPKYNQLWLTAWKK